MFNRPIIGLVSLLVLTLCGLNSVQVAASPVTQTFTVNSLADDGDADSNDTLCQTESGACTLRAAIEQINEGNLVIAESAFNIQFSVSGTITLDAANGALPLIEKPTWIDGVAGNGAAACPTDDGAGNLLVTLDGSNLTDGNGIDFLGSAELSLVRGLVIVGFPDSGINASASNLLIRCNIIGLESDGSTAKGNGQSGINVNASGVTIGGSASALRNVISGNGQSGIGCVGAASLNVDGNYIGTDATGLQARPNGGNGIRMNLCNQAIIGASSSEQGNVISGNQFTGVWLESGVGTLIVYNRIGIGSDDATPLGNGNDGIRIQRNSDDNFVSYNTIAHNGYAGIRVIPVSINVPDRNDLSRNSIFANDEIGIDLMPPTESGGDVTANDTGTGDADVGPNGLQNFPALSLVQASGRVVGSFDAAPGDYHIDIYENDSCDAEDHGEGQRWIGRISASESGGVVNFDATLATAPTSGKVIVAQATEAYTEGSGTMGNSSEFGPCYQFGTPTAVQLSGNLTRQQLPKLATAGLLLMLFLTGVASSYRIRTGKGERAKRSDLAM